MTRNKLRSDEWFDRRDEVGIRHRSALATLGLDPQFAAGRPIIGICNPVSEFNNCEIGLQDLIEPIKRGVAQAGRATETLCDKPRVTRCMKKPGEPLISALRWRH